MPKIEQNYQKIKENVTSILHSIEGEKELREGIVDTPDRVARMYREIFNGYEQDPSAILSKTFATDDVEDSMDIADPYGNGIVVVKDISFFSHCEHHMVPFYGKVHIGYIPSKRVVGLSKLGRVVEAYAHRLQVQERLTKQIANVIQKELNPLGVMVVIEAVHLCMVMRGLKNPTASTITSVVRGEFQKESVKNEFLHLIGVK